MALALLAVLPLSSANATETSRLSVSPAQLTLGSDVSASLVFQGPSGTKGLVLTANVGSVEGLRETAPGRFEATYRPPDKRFPQVAILSAVGHTEKGPIQAWTSLPLWGQGEAVIETRPKATLSVQIADRTFGPVQANAKGIATVPIVVPPGVTHGYHGKRPIDLGLPDTSHVHLAVSRSPVPADAGELVLWAYAVTPEGAPRADAALELKSDKGELFIQPAIPGVTEARWQPPTVVGEAVLTARLKGERKSVATLKVPIVPGTTERLELELDRTTHVAGQNPLVAVIRATDRFGNATREPPEVSASVGAVSEPREHPRGWVVRIAVPTRLPQSGLELRAGAGKARGSATVALRPAQASAVSFESASVETLSGKAVTVIVSVLDAYANLVAEPAPTLSATGTVSLSPRATPGTYEVRYQPPPGTPRDEIVAHLGPSTSTVRVDIRHPAALVLSPKLGVAANPSGIASPSIAGEAAYRFVLAGERFAAGVEAGWYQLSKSERARTAAGLEVGLEGWHSFFTFGAALAWNRPLGDRWETWVGAGPGLSVVSSRVRLADQPDQVDAGVSVGVHCEAGVAWRVWRGGPFAEMRLWVQPDSGHESLRGTISTLIVAAGYRFEAL